MNLRFTVLLSNAAFSVLWLKLCIFIVFFLCFYWKVWKQIFRVCFEINSFPFLCVYVKQLGTASALETLYGQAYGAKLYGKLGIQMQRAMFVLLIFSVPLSIIWDNTEQILVLVHQDKSIASVAGSYARHMIPSLFAYGPLQCINRFLQAQNNVFPVFVCSGITTCLHLLLCWLFVLMAGL